MSKQILSTTSSISRTYLRCTFRRFIHTTPTRLMAAAQTKGQAPEASRQPKERTLLEQNPHLKHAASSSGGNLGRDTGKGATAPNPELPSRTAKGGTSDSANAPGKKDKATRKKGTGAKPSKRGIHTSAVLFMSDSDGETKHTADNYFKEVDTNPPSSTKTHAVDSSSGAVQRPHEQYADPSKEYATVSKDEPYQPPAEGKEDGVPGESASEKQGQKEQKLRYGGTPRDQERDLSRPESGPERGAAGGRKPEGRT